MERCLGWQRREMLEFVVLQENVQSIDP